MSETRQFLDYLVDQRAPDVNPSAFSDILDRLAWLHDDNGSAIRAVLTAWLECDDLYRVQVALGLEEAFLFPTRATMGDAFGRLEKRWPQVKGRCDEILQAWDTTHSRSQTPT